MGFVASIVHEKKGFKLTSHGYEVPVVWMEDRPELGADDILVFPEGIPSYMKQTRHFTNTRVVIALSWAYVYLHLPKGENWKDYGISRAITPTPFIKAFLEWSMGIDVTLIGDYVDLTRFTYRPGKKKSKIAYMTRKSKIGEILCSIFRKKNELLSAYEWISMENFVEEEYAQHLVESRIYLATSSEEGRNISVLEAMASGCVVVGFSGLGGSDYMVGSGNKRNCVLIENGNYLELGKRLEEAVRKLEKDNHCFDSIITNAVDTVRPFGDFDKEAKTLKRFFKSL